MATAARSEGKTPTPTASKLPLISIIGTTGVGKSQLSISLAQSISQQPLDSIRCHPYTKSEIINSDSMQLYHGSPILTNKVTEVEMEGVKHHLMDFLDVGAECTVGKWRELAMSKVTELHSDNILPIVVGGTSYYLQNLLLPNNLVASPTSSPVTSTVPLPSSSPPSTTQSHTSASFSLAPASIANYPPLLISRIEALPVELLELFYVHPLLPNMSTPSIFPPSFPISLLPTLFQTPQSFCLAVYSLLTALDPESAGRWHWRDVRKVRRSLEIVSSGRWWSDVVFEQGERRSEGSRYKSVVFWIWCEGEVLEKRLDGRCEAMVEKGLVKEIAELWDRAGGSQETNYSHGIYQAIGFKEFEPYLLTLSPSKPSLGTSSPEQSSSSDTITTAESISSTSPLFLQSLDLMKVSTRQYAKSQIKWITHKLLEAIKELPFVESKRGVDTNPEMEGDALSNGKGREKEVLVYLLDATDLSKWNEHVLKPAQQIMHAYLNNKPLPLPSSLSPSAAKYLNELEADSSDIPLAPKPLSTTTFISCPICSTDPLAPYMIERRLRGEHEKSRGHRKRIPRVGGNQGDIWRRKVEEREKEKERLEDKDREGVNEM